MLRTLAFAVLASTFACRTDVPALGRSVALQDDAGVVAVTWDGATARVFRGPRLVAQSSAGSWDEALWSVDIPAYGAATAPHHYDRALTTAEVAALGDCGWSATSDAVQCGLDGQCDCERAQRSVPILATLR
ncbi:MAG: hypothetical protein H6737_06775 [Alphaproteobacteria bacterium]|nr:hypothetical protein [Alphaproteobacteria bacterium]